MSEVDHHQLEFVVPRMYAILPKAGDSDFALPADDSPVERDFGSDLVLFYAFDCDTHYEMVANRDLERLAATPDTLHERAVQNLRSLNLDVRAHQCDRVLMLTAGGNYEAVLPLLPELWDSVAEMVAGDLVISIPARDFLFVAGDAEQSNLADLRRLTSRAIENAEKPLSRCFFRRSGAGWEPYRSFAE